MSNGFLARLQSSRRKFHRASSTGLPDPDRRLEDEPDGRFDTIIFIDVIDHIEDDHGELVALIRGCDREAIWWSWCRRRFKCYTALGTTSAISADIRYRLSIRWPPAADLVTAHYLDSASVIRLIVSIDEAWKIRDAANRHEYGSSTIPTSKSLLEILRSGNEVVADLIRPRDCRNGTMTARHSLLLALDTNSRECRYPPDTR